MEIRYDRAALQQYMDDMEGVGQSMSRVMDESMNAYRGCLETYTRLHTEAEQAARRAYNQLEAAESRLRQAQAEIEQAQRDLENADEDADTSSIQERLRRAHSEAAEAQGEVADATAAYEKAQDNMRMLNEIMEQYRPAAETATGRIQDGRSAFATLVSNSNSDLGEYMTMMDAAQSALYEGGSAPGTGGGTMGAVAGAVGAAAGLTGAAGGLGTVGAVASALGGTASLGDVGSIASAAGNVASALGGGTGLGELGAAVGRAGEIVSTISDVRDVASTVGAAMNRSGYSLDSLRSVFRSSGAGNNILGILGGAAAAGIVLRLGGKEEIFPHTKSGAAKAYRAALKSGDTEMIAATDLLFRDFGSGGEASTGGGYLQQVAADLEAGLPAFNDRQMIMAGSQERRMRTPSEARGNWQGDTFVVDDDYVPRQANDDGLTFGQIRQKLKTDYGIDVQGIPYVDGAADFSGIAVGSVPMGEMVMRATGMTPLEYAGMTQSERALVYQDVFSDASDGKSKRSRNFDIADRIMAERQAPIPGLPAGYTADDLAAWRKEHKFSWDEQVGKGYLLVPAAIHGNLGHTGLVSTSKRSHDYLTRTAADMAAHPEKYAMDEDSAIISVEDLLTKKPE